MAFAEMLHVACAKRQRTAALQKLARLTILLLLSKSSVFAHDRHGNAAMNQDVHVQIEKDHVEVTFAIDTNNEAAIIEAIAMDANSDGKLSPEEQSAYFAQLDARLREGLQVSIGGRDVLLSPSSQVDLAPPASKTFRFRGDLTLGSKAPTMLAVYNDNFPDWPGRSNVQIEASDDFRRLVNFREPFPKGGSNIIHQFPGSPDVVNIVWREWSWPRLLLASLSIKIAAVFFTLVACAIMLVGKPSVGRNLAATCLIAASFAGVSFAFLNPQPNTIPPKTWQDEFIAFHDELSSALMRYHYDGNATSLSSFGSSEVVRKLTMATRIADPHDEKSGAFELRRVRPVATAILTEPRRTLFPTLRIHHEWRAIGLMRHEGHPHERVRDFACDYTLRVTDHGFQLLDCSNWHQLPDEPLEQ